MGQDAFPIDVCLHDSHLKGVARLREARGLSSMLHYVALISHARSRGISGSPDGLAPLAPNLLGVVGA